MSRLQEVLHETPPTTLLFLVVCALLHILQFAIASPELPSVTFCPRLVIYTHDYYRIITSALYHGSFMHIAVNSMSLMAIGSLLEKRMGSLALSVTILWSIIVTACLYILAALAVSYLFQHDGLMFQHSVGFSGVLFHLSVLECNLPEHQQTPRSVFGVIRVSAKLYPWVLLVALQLFLPNLSFTGHLAGILAGYLQYYNFLGCLIPRDRYFREMDGWWLVQSTLRRVPSYVPHSMDHRPNEVSAGAACLLGVQNARRFFGNLVETVCVILFGRGAEANANIQLPNLPGLHASDNGGNGDKRDYDDGHDDDDWNGLPSDSEVV